MSPIGEADLLVRLSQSNGSVMWTSLAGNVAIIETTGWASTDGVHDLGGSLMIERPDDPLAGTVDFGESPRSISFTFGN